LASFLIIFLSPEIATPINMCGPFPLSWIIVTDGSVSLHLLLPLCGYLTFMTCFYKFWYICIPVFIV
jgi:hypothetical protein